MKATTSHLLKAAMALATLSSCGEGKTAQISKGGNEVGLATAKAVDERAVSIPAVRNVLATEPRVDMPASNTALNTSQ